MSCLRLRWCVPMDVFSQWIFLAFIVERLAEYIGKLIPAIEKLENQFVNSKLVIALAFPSDPSIRGRARFLLSL